MGDAAVRVRDLVKRYPKGTRNAVDGLTFDVGRGEVFGLLGPNGAGKSTAIGILTTRVLATSGDAYVSGVDVVHDPVAARSHLAVVPQRVNLDRQLSARRNLTFHAAYHGVARAERERRADELLEQFGLADRGGDKVDRFSGGQSQRLMIARALMHRPDVLFLDEPSTGLDPQARLFVWDRVRDLQADGITIVLTTHDMDEAAGLCDRVGIVDHGSLLALDTPDALTKSLPGSATIDVVLESAASDALLDGLRALPSVERVEPDGASVRLYLDADPAAQVARVAAAVAAHDAALVDLNFGRASLEDVFISMTGRGLR
ncbi:ABC transporter ATP-binding protein [Jatrophihabitans endophyticus]|uniref:ABC transporter ATP-binding protein n=1 Tax=Jatrophihabitans endophyticus TaxID=1206085 RepID=UPI0019E81311|nr:ABC transporter ATP-binding protein [Jatrophihabitans endophyticus]MBE7188757.1 ABC transporter ATP-binding protein [Jatrophihabitans endophyticus]